MADRRDGPGGLWKALRGRGASVRMLVMLAGAGVVLILLSSMLGGAGATPPAAAGPPDKTASHHPAAAAGAVVSQDPIVAYEQALDAEAAAVLDQVAQAGPVTVAITVAGAPSRELARDTSSSQTRQPAGAGTSVQSSSQQALAYAHGEVPVATGESAPTVIGAVAVAPGAGDPIVRAELTQALETLLGLGANQVSVLPGRKGAG